MVSTSIDGISLDGFCEPVTVGELRETRCLAIPPDFGIYLIIRSTTSAPEFLRESTGGRFKNKDPSCPPEFVRENWIPGTKVVYVGKAAGRKGLRRRIYDLIAFGYGEPVGHWGGRLLWHLSDRENLLVRWRTCSVDDAGGAETTAIASFKAKHEGRRPYANLRK